MGLDVGRMFAELMGKAEGFNSGKGGSMHIADVDVLRDFDEALRLGIVSTNRDRTVRYVLSHFELEDVFDVACGRDPTLEEFRRTKPEPYYLCRAATAVDANDVLYVGDRKSDVVAAKNAGFDSALLRRSHNASLDPEVALTYEIESLRDLLQFAPSNAV